MLPFFNFEIVGICFPRFIKKQKYSGNKEGTSQQQYSFAIFLFFNFLSSLLFSISSPFSYLF